MISKNFQLNTAIAAIMEFTNFLYQLDVAHLNEEEHNYFIEALDTLMILLSPFCPHICEELWFITGHPPYISNATWPEYNETYLKKDEITLVVQINGKVRAEINVKSNITKEEAIVIAKIMKNSKYLEIKLSGRKFMCQKLLNFVIS